MYKLGTTQRGGVSTTDSTSELQKGGYLSYVGQIETICLRARPGEKGKRRDGRRVCPVYGKKNGRPGQPQGEWNYGEARLPDDIRKRRILAT
jgi:hypothetical protein